MNRAVPDADRPAACNTAPGNPAGDPARPAGDPAQADAARAAPTTASHAAVDDAPGAVHGAPLSAPNPHFAAIGGIAGITRLVERFYAHMRTRPDARTILALHDDDLDAAQAVLIRYLAYWMGGPQDYVEQSGTPRLRKKHLRFAIGPQERDAWLGCMRAALAETVVDPGLQRDLDQAFSRTADFIRNDQGTTHDHYRHDPARRP